MKTPLACLTAVLALVAFPPLRAAPADADPFAQTDPFVAANAALARDDFAAAEALVLPLATGAAPRADACALLGEIRLGQKRARDAVEFFEKAAQLDPTNALRHSRLGTAILRSVDEADPARRGELRGRALAALRRSIELEPDHIDGCLALAHFYAETPAEAGGDPDLAAAYAERVRPVNAWEPAFDARLLLASIAERRGRFEEALARYREAAGMWSASPDLAACEARVLARMGRIAEARACYERIIKGFPDWEAGRRALAALPADPGPT